MTTPKLPRHVGFIPDGNRRWAAHRGLPVEAGYAHGIKPGLALYEQCRAYGIKEASLYGFTHDGAMRPSMEKLAINKACVALALELAHRGAALLVLGDESSPQFPDQLREFRQRQGTGMKVNLLANYGWEWDLNGLVRGRLRSTDVSRLDLVVRWGGARRLSGFLPVQSVSASLYVRDEYWPDCSPQHLDLALEWYQEQERTHGG